MLRAYAERLTVLPLDHPEAADVALVDLLSLSDGRPRARPRLPIVALVPDDPRVRAVADLMGATAVLLASAPADRIAATLEHAHASAVLGARSIIVRPDTHPDVVLSPREAEILSLIGQGRTNDEITGELYLSLNTVKSHIRSAYRKIDVTTRAQAVIWCFTHGERGAARLPARAPAS